jgi:hypothetical protein
VRSALAELQRLEERGELLVMEFDNAAAEYERMLARYGAGYVLQLHVDMARMNVAAKQAQLDKHTYALWVARFKVENPFL